MQFKKQENFYVLKIARGEEINEQIKRFCQKEAPNGGFFSGIGAIDSVTLAHYRVDEKRYTDESFNQPLELTSLVGNVCFKENNEMIVHSHATLSDSSMQALAGHLVKGVISGACEILFFPFEEKIGKEYDEETGLSIMDL